MQNNINFLIFIILMPIIILYKNNENLNIDDTIGQTIAKNIFLFKYIHPNIITISGLLLNFYIYKLLNSNNKNIYLLGISLFYRWIADVLDGAVAREYNKKSKLGHYLDTFSDIILVTIILNYIFQNILGFSLFINNCIIIIILLYIIFNYNFLETHDDLKKNKKNSLINSILAFLTNNSYLYFYIVFIIYLYNMKIIE